MKKLIAAAIAITLPPLFILSCSNSNTDYLKIHDAQVCLDKATTSTAQSCINMVSGISSAAASLIRCGGIFIVENKLTPSGLQTIINGLQGGGTSNTNAMAALVFSSTTNASTAVTECAASGSAGLAMLGSMASVATTAASLGGGCGNPPSKACINGNASTIAGTAGVPDALATAYTQNCSNNSSNNPYQAFCTQYAAAAASGGSAQTIAQNFLGSLN